MTNKNVSCKLFIKDIYLERNGLCKFLFISTEDYLCILTYAYMYDKTDQICI